MEIVTDPNRYGVDWSQLAALLEAAGLGQRDPQVLQRVYQHSQFCYWGYRDGRLMATAHAISDMTSVAYLADVAIHPDFQGLGLGRQLMDRVMQDLAPLGKVFIYSVPDKLAFYKKYRFRELTTGMVYADSAALERLEQNGYLRTPL
ncbi:MULTISPECIES: GNAT family N-acetyltransferase [Serratia]|jgi:ribosomal protein S18 acetylase RimI-like enzyme|uniref:GNAT family N-acetyltransferase n=1 Tax=Serratia liquefaciens TaxID=614 RepID=A0ABX7D6T3_SERLI|nr:GNAT family N-acetyltransferase [Serratia liquefaciens]MBI6162738.1 GNAT family N-acetyltransferase [Serratia liquefaciens]MBV0844549.1 GNAT family N-acetyltransferase [Serratia liquefaciens]MDU5487619.1 GNAT family N-acetyltransferase [Serratia liquefaciens]QNQ53237.1 GNAT family N-acetyltransferase [Serratia liquefaciens]QQU56506.1 GNAT family N-acetyltransferase [Serratia liquefaciens]